MTKTTVLSIDASALDRIDLSSYIADEFAGLGAGGNTFWGGTPVSVFGGVYYVNGSQVLSNYGDASGVGTSPTVALIDGENLAYDFLNYGSAYGHGISGSIDSLTFGEWVDGQTTGTQGTGAAGAITGLDTGLTISGWDLSAAPGSGFDPAINPVYALYTALQNKDAAAINAMISDYTLDVTGSAGGDRIVSFGGADVLKGNGGNDTLDGAAGSDQLFGGAGNDSLFGRSGKDTIWGGAGSDRIDGGAGNDRLNGGTGNDKLFGGLGSDRLSGGAGNDLLRGGDGNDLLTGGAGADTFVFTAGAGVDRITDFNTAEDVIDLRAFTLSGFDQVSLQDDTDGAHVQVADITVILSGVEVAGLGSDDFLI